MVAPLALFSLLVMTPATFSTAPAQDTLTLSLAQVRELAREQAPTTAAAQARLDAARGAAQATATYPYNPRAELKTTELFSPGGSGEFEAIFSQELEWAGQIGLRRSVGRSGETAAEADYQNDMRLFSVDVDGAYYALVAATEKAMVYAEGARLTQVLRDAVVAQLREGQVSVLEANLAEIQSARSQADFLSVGVEVSSASTGLARILGLRPTTVIQGTTVESDASPQPLEDLADLLAAATRQRPDLSAVRARLEGAETLSRLESRRVVPNLGLAAVIDRDNELSSTTFGLRVSVGLPFWDRNQGARKESAALVRLQAELRRDAELRVQAEVSSAWARVRSARESMTLYESSVLEQARANRGLLERARSAGRLDLPTTLVLQSQLIEAEVAYWDVWLEVRLAETALDAAVGGA